jgi:hypothetical protein
VSGAISVRLLATAAVPSCVGIAVYYKSTYRHLSIRIKILLILGPIVGKVIGQGRFNENNIVGGRDGASMCIRRGFFVGLDPRNLNTFRGASWDIENTVSGKRMKW